MTQAIAPLWAGWNRWEPRSLPGPLGTRSDITFPETNLRLSTRVALGADLSADPSTWSWSEISERARWDGGNGVGIEDGRRDGSIQVTTTTARMMLDNRDARFTRRNPSSPYAGLLSTRTPIWVEVDPGDGGHTRLEAFVESWPVRWPDRSLNDCYVLIECAGIMRYLQQSPGDPLSALRRTILAAGPAGYWPMEDGSDTTLVSSAVPGVAAMSVEGTVNFATTDGPPGSGALCDGLFADAATFRAPAVIAAGTAAGFQISFVFRAGVTAGAAGIAVMWTDPNATTDIFWTIEIDSIEGQQVSVAASTDGATLGSTIIATTIGTVTFGQYYHCVYRQEADGTRVLYLDDVAYTGTDGTSGPPRNVQVTPAAAHLILPQGELSFGHFALWADSSTDVPGQYQAMIGYVGEQAHVRMARLCTEAGVLYSSLATTSELVGVQGVDTLLNLLREAEAVDQGVLHEKRWGLAYQSRTERYNQPVSLPLALTDLSAVPTPGDDNERVRNKWAVYSRDTGASATAELSTGPLGTGSGGPGELKDTATVVVNDDSQLDDQAGWRVHLSTVDEDRWPVLDIGLHRSPELIGNVSSLDYGARVQVTQPPTQAPPQTVDALVDGRRERINQRLWDVSLATGQALPYTVAIYGPADPNAVGTDHYDAFASTTAASFVSGTDTSMSVATTSGPLWTVDSDDFPFNIRVAGVVLTVTAISGASSPQTFTITQTPVNGVAKTIASASPVALDRTPIYAL